MRAISSELSAAAMKRAPRPCGRGPRRTCAASAPPPAASPRPSTPAAQAAGMPTAPSEVLKTPTVAVTPDHVTALQFMRRARPASMPEQASSIGQHIWGLQEEACAPRCKWGSVSRAGCSATGSQSLQRRRTATRASCSRASKASLDCVPMQCSHRASTIQIHTVVAHCTELAGTVVGMQSGSTGRER